MQCSNTGNERWEEVLSQVKFLFFDYVLNDPEPVRSADTTYARLASGFDALEDFPGWTFSEEDERAAAFELARVAPDALILSVYQWNTYLTHRGKRPRRWVADYAAMKRLAATALAECYPAAQMLDLDAPLRAAIWVPWLPKNPNNNILRVVAGYLGGLRQQEGIETALVLTNELSYPTSTQIPNARRDVRSYRATLEEVIAEYGSPPDALYIAPPPFVDEGNLAWFQKFQATFRPDVIFVPNFEMSSAHIHGFGKSAATVYLQTSVRNRPPYDFTRYLYLGEERQIDNSHIHPDRWHYHPFGYGNFGTGSGLTRAEIGLPQDAFVVVSAGNRLEAEIDSEIAEIMANLMEKDPRIVWMLMGVKSETKIHENLGPRFASMADRVICNGYVREIGDYLSLSDVYANPRRTGGAVSMALAVYGKTPVLSFYGNDACNFLIDDMMQETPEAYQAQLAALAADPDYLDRIVSEQQARFERNHTITASAADLVTHMRAARAEWVPS